MDNAIHNRDSDGWWLEFVRIRELDWLMNSQNMDNVYRGPRKDLITFIVYKKMTIPRKIDIPFTHTTMNFNMHLNEFDYYTPTVYTTAAVSVSDMYKLYVAVKKKQD